MKEYEFDFWQTGKCILKFLAEPQVTNLRVEFNGHQPMFPTLTICNKKNEDWTNFPYNKVSERMSCKQ